MPIQCYICGGLACRVLTAFISRIGRFVNSFGATALPPREIFQMFSGRVVSLREAVPCPPRSPDLSPCDFFVEVPQGRGF